MESNGIIRIDDENYDFPIIEGTEQEKALDLRSLRAKTGLLPLMKATEIPALVKVRSPLSTERKEY